MLSKLSAILFKNVSGVTQDHHSELLDDNNANNSNNFQNGNGIYRPTSPTNTSNNNTSSPQVVGLNRLPSPHSPLLASSSSDPSLNSSPQPLSYSSGGRQFHVLEDSFDGSNDNMANLFSTNGSTGRSPNNLSLVLSNGVYSKIPIELMQEIISYIDYRDRFRTIRVVSHRWNNLLLDSEKELFLCFSKNTMLRFMTHQDVLDFVRRFSKLSQITIYNAPGASAEIQAMNGIGDLRRKVLREIQATSPCLRKLTLIDTSESELTSVRDLVFNGLTHLYLQTHIVTSNMLTIIHDMAPSISHLELRYALQEKGESICKIYNTFGKLKDLKLVVDRNQSNNAIFDSLNLSQLTTLEMHHFMGFMSSKTFPNLLDLNVSGSVNDLQTVVHLFPNLTSLDISSLYGASTDKSEMKLCENLPKLTHLKRLIMTDFTSGMSMIDSWPSSWTTLKELDISRITINDSQIEKLAKLSNLEVLKMRGLSITGKQDGGIGDVLTSLQGTLRELDISECKSLVNILPANSNPALTCFTKLTILNANGANTLSENSIEYIVSSSPNLRHLSLMACNEIKDGTIGKISSSKIVYMDLRYCRQIGNGGFLQLVNEGKLKSLEHLKLALCFDVSHVSLESILKNSKFLKTLELNSCGKVDSDYLISKELIDPLTIPSLSHLDLSGTKIGDKGLLNLLTSTESVQTPLSNLVSLRVSDCYNLTHEFLEELEKYLQKIDKPKAVIPFVGVDKKVVYFRCPYLQLEELKQSLPRHKK